MATFCHRTDDFQNDLDMKNLAISLILLLLSCDLTFAQSLGNGPVTFRNAYPLAVSQLSVEPHSPSVLGESGQISSRSSFSWSNTYNDDSKLTVDGESRLALQSLTFAASNKTDFSLALPLHWRGGGVLDSPIENWHDTFGMPQGGRDKVPANRFSLNGQNEDDSTFAINQSGLGLGDIAISGKTLLLENPQDSQLSASFTAQLPTGTTRYSNNAVELMLETALAKRYSRLVVYTGAGFAWSSKDNYQGAKLRRNRPGGFLSLAYLLSQETNIGTSYRISAHPNAPVKVLPETEQYWDFFITHQTKHYGQFEFAIRENPSSGNSTTDITVLLALSKSWGAI